MNIAFDRLAYIFIQIIDVEAFVTQFYVFALEYCK